MRLIGRLKAWAWPWWCRWFGHKFVSIYIGIPGFWPSVWRCSRCRYETPAVVLDDGSIVSTYSSITRTRSGANGPWAAVLALFFVGCSAHGVLLRDPQPRSAVSSSGGTPRLTLTVEGADLANQGLYFAPNVLPPSGVTPQRWVPPELLPPANEAMVAKEVMPPERRDKRPLSVTPAAAGAPRPNAEGDTPLGRGIDPKILEWWESLVRCAAAGDERCLKVLAALEGR